MADGITATAMRLIARGLYDAAFQFFQWVIFGFALGVGVVAAFRVLGVSIRFAEQFGGFSI